LLCGVLLLCCWVTGKAQSNKGTEFWTAYMHHVNGITGSAPSGMNLYIASDANTTGTVEIADGSFAPIPFTIAANNVQVISIPTSAFINTEGYFSKGIHIKSERPIAVYAHIYAQSVSGATLLLPVNAMGKDYYSLNYTQISNNSGARSSFSVIATEDNTQVEITPAAALTSGAPANRKFTVTLLKKGDLYQGLSFTDLTGTKIRSVSAADGKCKKVAVFSGSGKIGIGCSSPGSLSSDNFFQQVYPTASWGRFYITAPLKNRPYDVYRIVLSDPSTVVTLNGSTVPSTSFSGGLYYEFTATTPNVISADKPIQVVQYSATQNQTLDPSCRPTTGDTGDPEMIYVPAIEQSIDHVTLYSTGQFRILANYINIIIPATAISSFVLDGVPTSKGFLPVPGNTTYAYAQFSVGEGRHTISASEGFNAIAYGFGNAESYGYAAGTNLRNLNESLVLSQGNNTTQLNGCTDVPYTLKLVVPYPVTKIDWNLGDGTKTTENSPTPVNIEQHNDGTTLYHYQYNQAKPYAPGYYVATATVTTNLITDDDCGSTRDISFNFTITDFPVANFVTTGGVCEGASIQFNDKSDPKQSSIVSWIWNFGDASNSTTTNPNTSIAQNPTHIYSHSGSYEVTLSVVNQNGCSSQLIKRKRIYINSIPVVHIQPSLPNCVTQSITFSDKSTTVNGTVNKWLWDFGDVNATAADNVSLLKNPTHVYSQPGTYKVKLQVTTDSSCVSATDSIQVLVGYLPKADFNLPDVCLDNATATFINKSTITGNTPLTYKWDFGDPLSTAANNTSEEKDSKHTYHETRDASNPYKVKLTVTSASGCIKDTTLNLVVNGSNPKPKFSLDAANTYCSKDSVVFNDESVPDFGVITRLRWYFDVDNNPEQYEEFLYRDGTIHTNKKYKHFYGLSRDLTPRTFKVRLEVSSGEGCEYSSPITQITVFPNPIVTLGNIPAEICQEKEAVQITENTNGFVGVPGVFTGDGITAGGLFTPKNAGPGLHTIKYVFKADVSQCANEQTFTIFVNPSPIVSGKRNITILPGERVTLEPLALSLSGKNLTYKWTPAIGLDRTNIANPVASPTTDTQYLLTVKSDNGCEAYALFNITVLQQPLVYNTFTPNGDGRNDTWIIPNMEDHPKAVVEVLNRNGQRVFYSIGYPLAWDGRFNGTDLPAATYYYIIDLKDGKKPLSGPLTIIR
jgi:gliding motility-associated-like protein